MAKSPAEEHPKKAFGWAARDTSGVLFPFNFSRRFVFLLPISFFYPINAKKMKDLISCVLKTVNEVCSLEASACPFTVLLLILPCHCFNA